MSKSVIEHPTIAALRREFGVAVQHDEVNAGDEHVVHVAADKNLEVLRWLHDDPGQQYDLLRDVTAVDFGGGRPLQVVYQLFSIPLSRSLRLKCELALESLEIASVCPIWATANWLEREVYDLFGITFKGHPDLRRILMPPGYAEGHPLRKDFPLRGRFSRAEQTRRAMNLVAEDYYVAEQMGSAGEPQLAPSRLDLEALTPDSPISSDG